MISSSATPTARMSSTVRSVTSCGIRPSIEQPKAALTKIPIVIPASWARSPLRLTSSMFCSSEGGNPFAWSTETLGVWTMKTWSRSPSAAMAAARPMARSFGASPETWIPSWGPIPRSTPSASDMCGIAFGLTKDAALIALDPASISPWTSSTLRSVGRFSACAWSASRGPTSLMTTWLRITAAPPAARCGHRVVVVAEVEDDLPDVLGRGARCEDCGDALSQEDLVVLGRDDPAADDRRALQSASSRAALVAAQSLM